MSESLKENLNKDFRQNIPLENYAQKFQVSKEWMSRIFKKDFGVTPIAYRNKKRVFQSMIDLQMQNQTIIDVSQHNGFEDLSHFYDFFKRIMKSSPGRFAI